MLTKEKVKKLMKLEGSVRGMALRVDLDFIREKKGEDGLKKIEARMKELGHPLKYEEIKPMDFYPMGLSAISLLVIEEIFNFSKKELKEWGELVVKFSILMKIFMKYFGSLSLVAKQIPGVWRKHYTIGRLEMPDFSEESKYVILRLYDFKINPIYCNIYLGYFSKTASMVLKNKITIKETKFMFRGDPYHEFLLTW